MASKGCAFLMDMGTGKTITTIAVAGTSPITDTCKKHQPLRAKHGRCSAVHS